MKTRKRIFIGCEGASERSYVRWLQRLADDLGKRLAFDAHIIGGGDPLGIVEESLKKLRAQERRYGPYRGRAILLDSDRIGQTPERDHKIPIICRGTTVALLYQRFDHEAVLLRHFKGCERLRPPRGYSLGRLRREWPDYSKPADALALSQKLQAPDLRRFLNVEADFNAFLSPLLF
jgi:hypothetical protein